MPDAKVNDVITTWRSELREFIRVIRAASLEERASQPFQQRLWEDNPISDPGMGTVKVAGALENDAFRHWLAEQSLRELPTERAERTAVLTSIYQGILDRTEDLCDRRPFLKILRVMAALFPLDFTTIASRHALKQLQYNMFGPAPPEPVEGNVRVRTRIDDLLGAFSPDDLDTVIERLTLPWMVYSLITTSDPHKTTVITVPGMEALSSLPAARRRRGLSAFKGLFTEMLSILEYVRDEPTRDELLDHLRSGHPTSKDVTLRQIINVLTSEFGVIRHDGERYRLTARGQALVDSGDPDELRDWLLTRILGVDNVLVLLRDNGQKSQGELDTFLQGVNPGWTSTFATRVMIKWLRTLDVVVRLDSGRFDLTKRGREWAGLVSWEPGVLEVALDDEPDAGETAEPIDGPPDGPIKLPTLSLIVKAINDGPGFPPPLIASLHMGLWARPRRHFAILTGLSGSGKTLLARAYGKTIIGDEPEAGLRLRTIPVQPGWYDPTPLFGYVNPLTKDTYESTPFLELLLHALEHPSQPHVVVLDEMNLSHPEQYLAPVLSAMETGAELHLHSKEAHFDGIPSRVPYPNNLVVIGTVNMDETTMGLSDKVLDRAFVLEFWKIDLDQWPGWAKSPLPADEASHVKQVLGELMGALEPGRLHFGWRVIDEVVSFLALRGTSEHDLEFVDALDRVVYAKIIPKLRGEDAPRFRQALEACEKVLTSHGLLLSQAKVGELRSDLDTMGSARFWR